MDNVVSGVNHPTETLPYCEELFEIFKEGGMKMREFASNDGDSIGQLPVELRLTGMTSGERIKVLGITWDTFDDTFRLPVPPTGENLTRPLTKRCLLSLISTPFDPLGLISPFLLMAKRVLSELWSEKKSWDEPLSEEEVRKWDCVATQWREAHPYIIPRRYFDWHPKGTQYELHTFSDASTLGIGYAIYLRAKKKSKTAVSLVFARSQVVPAGKRSAKQTVPRLELQAAASASRATDFVRKELELEIGRVQLWCDSQCVVQWLMARHPQKDVFINNRLQKLSHQAVRHVQGEENPADVASRGAEWNDPPPNWFNGPTWLSSAETEWPVTPWIYDPTQEPPEGEKIFISIAGAATKEQEPPKLLFEPTRLSIWWLTCPDQQVKTEWRKLKGIAAFVLRFLRNRIFARWSKSNSFVDRVKQIFVGPLGQGGRELSAEELDFAEKLIIRENQTNVPLEEQNNLAMWRDEDDLLRCGGRIDHADLPAVTKWPYYIPRTSAIAKLIAMDSHIQCDHHGQNWVLAHIRRKFWIPAGRRLIKSLRCSKCLRHNARPFAKVRPPPLPFSRVTQAAAWSRIGVDYFGPLTIYDGKESKKCWAALFTCQLSRAIHIELALDYSADAFVSTLRRFIALRRLPDEIISDNGTNFTAAAKALRELWEGVMRHPRVQNFSATRGIRWTFITEAAPWRGGFWERMIGTVKSAMRRSLGRWRMTWLQLATILHEIAATVNERPLTVLPDKPDWFLRPIDLIRLDEIGVNTLPHIDVDDEKDPEYRPRETDLDRLKDSLGKAVNKLQKFWEIWSTDYRLSLRERQQKLSGPSSKLWPAPGSVVLIGDDDQPRNSWRMGRIEEVITSKDGAIRSAKVRVVGARKAKKGPLETRILNRPVNALFPLEWDPEDGKDQGTEKGEPNPKISSPGTRFIMNDVSSVSLGLNMEDELDYDDFNPQERQLMETSGLPTPPHKDTHKEAESASSVHDAAEQQAGVAHLPATVALVTMGAMPKVANLDGKSFRKAPANPTTQSAEQNSSSKRARDPVEPERRHSSPPRHKEARKERHSSPPRHREARKESSRSHRDRQRFESRPSAPQRGEARSSARQRYESRPPVRPAPQRRQSPRPVHREPERTKTTEPRVREPNPQPDVTQGLPNFRARKIPPSWELLTVCDRREQHKDCRPVYPWSIAQAFRKFEPLSGLDAINDMRLDTLLQRVLAAWLIEMWTKESDQKSVEPFFRALQQPTLSAFETFGPAIKPTIWKTDFKESVILKACEVHRAHCRIAERDYNVEPEAAWQSDHLQPIEASFPKAREVGQLIPRRMGPVLTGMRANHFFPNTVVVMQAKTVMVGDQVARNYTNNLSGIYYATLPKIELIGNFFPHNYYLGSQVETVILWTGKEFINGGGTATAFKAVIRQILSWSSLGKEVIVVAPALVRMSQFRGEWQEIQRFVGTLQQKMPGWRQLKTLVPKIAQPDASDEFVDDYGNPSPMGQASVDQELGEVLGRSLVRRSKLQGQRTARAPGMNNSVAAGRQNGPIIVRPSAPLPPYEANWQQFLTPPPPPSWHHRHPSNLAGPSGIQARISWVPQKKRRNGSSSAAIAALGTLSSLPGAFGAEITTQSGHDNFLTLFTMALVSMSLLFLFRWMTRPSPKAQPEVNIEQLTEDEDVGAEPEQWQGRRIPRGRDVSPAEDHLVPVLILKTRGGYEMLQISSQNVRQLRVRGKRVRLVELFTAILAIMTIGNCQAHGKESGPRALWCRNEGSQFISIPDKLNCSLPSGGASFRAATLDVWEPAEAPISVSAHLCTIRTDQVRLYKNILGDSFPTKHPLFQRMEPEECLMMAKRGRCGHGTLVPTNGGGLGTQNKLVPPDPGLWDRLWRNERQSNITNCYSHNISVYVDRESWEVSVPGKLRIQPCKVGKGHCQLDSNEIVVWTLPLYTWPCKYRLYKGNWTGEFSNTERVWTDSGRNMALTFPDLQDPKVEKDCKNRTLVCADQGFCLSEQQFRAMVKPPIRPRRELATEQELIARVTAAQIPAVTNLNRTIQVLRQRECERAEREIKSLPARYRQNPTEAAREILNRTSVQARWVAQRMLQVWECVPIPLKELRFRPSGNACYQYLPVRAMILGRNWTGFLDTAKMILSGTSAVGPCPIYGIQFITINDSHSLAVDQRTARPPTDHPRIREWNPNLRYGHYPEVHITAFHHLVHNPHELPLIPDHEEILRLQAAQTADSAQIEEARAGQNSEFDLVGQAEAKLVGAFGRLRWHWLNLVGLVVSADILIFLLALFLQKLLEKLRLIRGQWAGQPTTATTTAQGAATSEAHNDESSEGSRRRKRRRVQWGRVARQRAGPECREPEGPA